MAMLIIVHSFHCKCVAKRLLLICLLVNSWLLVTVPDSESMLPIRPAFEQLSLVLIRATDGGSGCISPASPKGVHAGECRLHIGKVGMSAFAKGQREYGSESELLK
jgi:hypothetical protein